MSELPEGWEFVPLSEVTEGFINANPRKDGGSYSYIDIGGIDNERQKIVETKIVEGASAPSRARRIVHSGDVLFSTVRPYLKNIALVPSTLDGALTSTGITVLRPANDISSKLMFRWVSSKTFVDEVSHTQVGALYPAVSDSDVLAGEMPIPPAAEQKRIVAKLDSLSAHSRRARAELEAIPRLIARYKQAILAAAFSRPAEIAPMDSLLERLTSGSRDWAKYYDQGKGVFVLAANVRPMSFDSTPKRFVDPPRDGTDAIRSRIMENDILVTIVGANTGDTCRVGRSLTDYYVCQSVALLRPKESWRSKFIELFINSELRPGGQVSKAIYGAGRPHLSFTDLKTIQVPVLEREATDELVARIETAFAAIDHLATEHASASKLLDRLDQSILVKAFRGELVPQFPNDEPASVLLERIRAERAAAPKPKRTRRKRNE